MIYFEVLKCPKCGTENLCFPNTVSTECEGCREIYGPFNSDNAYLVSENHKQDRFHPLGTVRHVVTPQKYPISRERLLELLKLEAEK